MPLSRFSSSAKPCTSTRSADTSAAAWDTRTHGPSTFGNGTLPGSPPRGSRGEDFPRPKARHGPHDAPASRRGLAPRVKPTPPRPTVRKEETRVNPTPRWAAWESCFNATRARRHRASRVRRRHPPAPEPGRPTGLCLGTPAGRRHRRRMHDLPGFRSGGASEARVAHRAPTTTRSPPRRCRPSLRRTGPEEPKTAVRRGREDRDSEPGRRQTRVPRHGCRTLRAPVCARPRPPAPRTHRNARSGPPEFAGRAHTDSLRDSAGWRTRDIDRVSSSPSSWSCGQAPPTTYRAS